jgi:hypothetical protein
VRPGFKIILNPVVVFVSSRRAERVLLWDDPLSLPAPLSPPGVSHPPALAARVRTEAAADRARPPSAASALVQGTQKIAQGHCARVGRNGLHQQARRAVLRPVHQIYGGGAVSLALPAFAWGGLALICPQTTGNGCEGRGLTNITASKPITAWIDPSIVPQEKEGTERLEWRSGYIVSLARQNRLIPGGLRKTSRTVDRTRHALIPPIFDTTKEAETAPSVSIA